MESALFIAATGMKGLAQGMQVTTNNLANVSTIGYKQQQILYSDLIYTGQSDSQGNMGNWWCTQENSRVAIGQVGHGLQVETIRTLFQQSAFESSNTLTDLAINGKGFFIVKDANGNEFYTRAGDFRSDNQGVWRMPEGHALQGYRISENGTASSNLEDIKVDPATYMPAKATGNVQATFNINPNDNRTSDINDPFFSLLKQYDATSAGRPIAKGATSYEEGVTVYDNNGTAHTLNFFFDGVDSDSVISQVNTVPEFDNYGARIYRTASGERVWPDGNGGYVDQNGVPLLEVTGISPSVKTVPSKFVEFVIAEDVSTVPVQYDSNGNKLDRKSTDGLLMSGILQFDSSGELIGVSAYTPASGNDVDLADLENWIPVTGNSPVLNMNGVNMAIDFGVRGYATNSNYAKNAGEVGNNANNLTSRGTEDVVRSAEASTGFDGRSPAGFFIQNGYPQGSLSNLSVNKNGYVIGHYSNGQDQKLWQIPIANFTSDAGLYREGSNLFGYTKDCGQTYIGMAGTGNYGSINSYNIETSNVDYATEMVNMIVTQRGFQSNSKVITTQNEMLQTAIQLKRA